MKNNKACSIFIENNIWDAMRGVDHNRSPIRYPGGKTRAVATILSLIPKEIKTVVSPFLGGGSVETALSDYGISVYGYDTFDRLVNFWKVLRSHPKSLATKLTHLLPGDREQFYTLKNKKYRKGLNSAAEFVFVNRASFSGLSYSGGYSKSSNQQKFTSKYIDFIRNYVTLIHVGELSFAESIREHRSEFLYLDPPYLLSKSNNKLYGKQGSTHAGFGHDLLKSCLEKHKGPWMMSYNNDDNVKELYRGYQMIECGWGYSMNIGKDTLGKKKGEKRELLIFSPCYPEICFRD